MEPRLRMAEILVPSRRRAFINSSSAFSNSPVAMYFSPLVTKRAADLFLEQPVSANRHRRDVSNRIGRLFLFIFGDGGERAGFFGLKATHQPKNPEEGNQ